MKPKKHVSKKGIALKCFLSQIFTLFVTIKAIILSQISPIFRQNIKNNTSLPIEKKAFTKTKKANRVSRKMSIVINSLSPFIL